MNEKEKEIFEKRELANRLVEENELALIELNVKIQMFDWYQMFIDHFEDVCEDVDQSKIIPYINKKLLQKVPLQIELLHAKSNTNKLLSRRESLWEK